MGRVAIVTGASQGLGEVLAGALARAGWSVVVDARDGARLAAAVESMPGDVLACAGDVTDPDHRRRLVSEATRLGPIDLVVNNASTLGESPLPALDRIRPQVLRRTFEVNVIAPLALVAEAIPHLAHDAAIVNITSDAAIGAYPGWGGYGSSKAALEQASRVLAAEHPELRVLVVDPGDMRTEMHQDAFPGEDISDRPEPSVSVPGLVALIEEGRPSGRYEAREVA